MSKENNNLLNSGSVAYWYFKLVFNILVILLIGGNLIWIDSGAASNIKIMGVLLIVLLIYFLVLGNSKIRKLYFNKDEAFIFPTEKVRLSDLKVHSSPFIYIASFIIVNVNEKLYVVPIFKSFQFNSLMNLMHPPQNTK